MKYCYQCGAVMKEEAVFCGQCGKSSTQRGTDQETSPSNEKKTTILPWLGLGLVIVSISSYFIYPDVLINVNSYISGMNRSGANSSELATNPGNQNGPNQSNQQVMPAAQMTATVLNDFRIYVQAKERLNTDIIDLSSQINHRINQNGGLRNSQDLKSRAQRLVSDAEKYSNQLSGNTYPSELQVAKLLLLELFNLEITRVRSLYNGLIEGGNGQDYGSSFSVGTSAAYKFDELNVKFVQENDLLDNKVRR